MTGIAKSKWDTSQSHCDSEEDDDETPTGGLWNVEEGLTWYNVPADLQMHGERSDEDFDVLVFNREHDEDNIYSRQ